MKHTGDGIGSWFSSPSAACECALATREDLADHNASYPETPLFVRFGLASGTPIPHEGDLYGVSMSLAAAHVPAGIAERGACLRGVAAEAAAGRLAFRPLQPVSLKGFPEPVPAFAVGRRD